VKEWEGLFAFAAKSRWLGHHQVPIEALITNSLPALQEIGFRKELPISVLNMHPTVCNFKRPQTTVLMLFSRTSHNRFC
jgi:hypothetical protein